MTAKPMMVELTSMSGNTVFIDPFYVVAVIQVNYGFCEVVLRHGKPLQISGHAKEVFRALWPPVEEPPTEPVVVDLSDDIPF